MQWKQIVDIKPFISTESTNGAVSRSLVGVSKKLYEGLWDRTFDQPNYDSRFQEILDDLDNLAIVVKLQPPEVTDQELLNEANQILLRLYDYGDEEGICLG